jgi:LysR family cyn operon transcriptional activator
MELRQLKYFIKAKELLNFTAAANALHISQSTLSQQIKQLEIELKVPLFNRIGKRIQLTEAGCLFYGYAIQSVQSATNGFDMLRDLNNLETGILKIGATYGLKHVLTKSVTQFLKLYPKIKVQVVYGTSEELVIKLDKFELDFILSFQEFETTKKHTYQTLFVSEMVLIGAENSFLKELKSIPLKELTKLPLALPASGFSTRKHLDAIAKKNNLTLSIPLEVNDIPMLLDIIKTGTHYTVLAKTTVQDTPLIKAVPIASPKIVRKGMIISIKGVYEKKSVLEFHKIIRKIMQL